MAVRGVLVRAVARVGSRPAAVLLGAGWAAATVLAVFALVGLAEYAGDDTFLDVLVGVGVGLLVYDALLTVLAPAVTTPLFDHLQRPAGAADSPFGDLRDAVLSGRADAVAAYREALATSAWTRLGALGASVLAVPLTVAVLLIVATAVSLALYALELVRTPGTDAVGLGVAFAVWSIWAAGKLPSAYARALAQEGESPRRAWLASAGLVRRHPRDAGIPAAVRLALAGLPLVVLIATGRVVPSGGAAEVAVPFGAFALALLVVRPLEAAIEVEVVATLDPRTEAGTERPAGAEMERPAGAGSERPAGSGSEQPADAAKARPADSATGRPADVTTERPTTAATEQPTTAATEPTTAATEQPTHRALLDPSRLRPSRRVLLALLVLTSLAVASGAIRVTDARPNVGPGDQAAIDVDDPELGAEDPAALYASARERTQQSSRELTLERHTGNWSRAGYDPAFRTRLAIDFQGREAAATGWTADDDGWEPVGNAYYSDGLVAAAGTSSATVRPDLELDRREFGDWTAVAAVEYADLASNLAEDDLPAHETGWAVVDRTDATVVLGLDDPAEVRRFARHDDPSYVWDSDARVRVRIDAESGRIREVAVRQRFVAFESEDHERVERRIDDREVRTYEYDDLGIERPDAVGTVPAEWLWDLAYY